MREPPMRRRTAAEATSARTETGDQPTAVSRAAGFDFSSIDIFPAPSGLTDAPGAGAPLSADLRARMEAAFQTDFSAVQVFENPAAAQLGARAFTSGDQLHFAPGRFQPDTPLGLELLGHELTHVVQQRHGAVRPADMPGAAINLESGLEREAETLGGRAARGETVSVPGGGSGFSRSNSSGGAEAVIQASPEDEHRLRQDLEARANSVWQAKGSPMNQDQGAQSADWQRAQGQQKAEIERRANLEYHARFTADASHNVSAPAHSDEKMREDYLKAEGGFQRELRNRARAANPTSVSGGPLSGSGEFVTEGATPTQPVRAVGHSEIKGRTPDPSNPGKLSDDRKNLLQKQLDASGRTNSLIPFTSPSPVNSSLKQTDKAQYDLQVQELGKKRASGIQEDKVTAHLETYLGKNSKDEVSSTGVVTRPAPLGHAHSAHGYQIPAVEQIERELYGIRPDERGQGSDPMLQAKNTPGAPINVTMTGLTGKGKNPTEQQEFNNITQVSSFPQITLAEAKTDPNPANLAPLSGNALKGRKSDLGFEVGKGGTASQFTSPLAEYQSLNQNFAQAWQSKDDPDFTLGTNVAVTSQNTGNPLGSTHPKAATWQPDEYGRGFKFQTGSTAPKLKREDADAQRTLDTQARARDITVERQNSSKTVVKKLEDTNHHMNGFDVTTNFPNNDPQGINKKGPANTTVNVGSTFQPQQSSARTDKDDLKASLNRIQGSTKGNIAYQRDPLEPDKQKALIRDPKTGNPLPELDINGKPKKSAF